MEKISFCIASAKNEKNYTLALAASRDRSFSWWSFSPLFFALANFCSISKRLMVFLNMSLLFSPTCLDISMISPKRPAQSLVMLPLLYKIELLWLVLPLLLSLIKWRCLQSHLFHSSVVFRICFSLFCDFLI